MNRFLKLRSIATEFCATISLLLVALVAALVLYINSTSYKMVMETQLKDMRQLNQSALFALEEYLSRYEILAETLAANPSVVTALSYGNAGRAKGFVQKVVEADKGIVSAMAFRSNGKVLTGWANGDKDLTGSDVSGQPFFKAVMEEKRKSFISAQPTMGEHGNVFYLACKIHDAGGIVIGIDFNTFTDRFIKTLSIGTDGYAYMMTGDGTIIQHPTAKNIGNRSSVIDQLLPVQKEGKLDYLFYNYKGRDKVQTFRAEPQTGWLISITVYVDDLTAVANTQRLVIIGAGAVGLGLIIVLLVWGFRRSVGRPVRRIIEYANHIASGNFHAELEGNFKYELAELASHLDKMSAELKEKFGFVQGVLDGIILPCVVMDTKGCMTYLNQDFLDLLGKPGTPEDYMGACQDTTMYGESGQHALAQRALEEEQLLREERTVTMEDGREVILDISATPIYNLDGKLIGVFSIFYDMTSVRAAEESIRRHNERIAAAAERATEISQRLNASANSLAEQLEDSRRGAQVQKERTGENATAMEEMNATVLEVARNAGTAAENANLASDKARTGAQVVEQAVEAINRVKGQSESLSSVMRELGQQAGEIGQVLQVINDIADQTNLLALNAAIEAARAGDAGRGFAVVADEVRKLAEKTVNATKEVGDVISRIQEGTAAAVRDTETATKAVGESTDLTWQSGEVLKEILEVVESTSSEVSAIATAAEQQSAASEEISRGTAEIDDISSQTMEAMVVSSRAVKELEEQAQELRDLILSMQD
ncbi:methyl-accepting chemotaxis protein [Salidesulfovibrio onnuriiensis]|uniref:methyl-accepting chemotaxis protein n=1 Tax=Salidesulfovibrio onnuriiensis TaxID=2583823 RepID=UPI0011C8118A|nr:methyl-accepting chemotaxis protein [Salidesulfovibrio onnuriiensis]